MDKCNNFARIKTITNISARTRFFLLLKYRFYQVLPVKQQLKWCDKLQLLSDAIDWSTIYENNYYATNETILRSFQIRLNFRSIVTNAQLYVLDIGFNN